MRDFQSLLGRVGVLISLLLLGATQACQQAPEALFIGTAENPGTRQAIELAVEQINAAGGINGSEMRVVFASAPEGQTVAHRAVAIADVLSKDPRILGVVGHDGSTKSLPAAYVYNRNGVVQIAPGSSNPLITDVGPWIFRLSVNDTLHGEFLADVAIEKLEFDDIAVLFTNNDYGKMLVDSFMDHFKALGGTIRYVGFFSETDLEIVDVLSDRMIESDFHQIFLIGTAPGLIRMLDRFEEKGFTATILSSDTTFGVGFAHAVGEALAGSRVFASTFYNPLDQRPATLHFRKIFKEKYNREPEPNEALYYDAVNLLAEAIGHSGADRKSIRDYIAGIGNRTPPFEGASGRILFEPDGNNHRPVTIIEFGKELTVFESRVISKETSTAIDKDE